jgi:putative acetyltransferase
MKNQYQGFVIRDWQPHDRLVAAEVVRSVLAEYGLGWEPEATDRDVLQVEAAYWETGGEFWVVEHQGQIVGTAGYYPIDRGSKAVELRKMYLLPEIRGKGLGRHLLQLLEQAIALHGFEQIWIETSSKLKEAIKLYESSGYQPDTTEDLCAQRCDRVYVKSVSG